MNILAVDDDREMTELTAMLLRTHGFQVAISNSAQEAIQLTRDPTLQAVVLDMMMPEMDGREISRAIRQFSAIPIIILSALSDPQSVASALDSGADDYLVKPVTSDVLAAHLTRLIKRTGGLVAPPAPRPAGWVVKTEPIRGS